MDASSASHHQNQSKMDGEKKRLNYQFSKLDSPTMIRLQRFILLRYPHKPLMRLRSLPGRLQAISAPEKWNCSWG